MIRFIAEAKACVGEAVRTPAKTSGSLVPEQKGKVSYFMGFLGVF